jgi:pyruvate dehydrogenase (quinone)
MNGLYDAKMDSAPVIAITGLTFHDLIDTRFMQDVNTVELMKGVALYNTAVNSAGHALVVTDIACRSANRGTRCCAYHCAEGRAGDEAVGG